MAIAAERRQHVAHGVSRGLAVSYAPLSRVAATAVLALLSPLLGVMEVMSPCMLSGMFGGMWGGMWPLTGSAIWGWGIGTGLTVVVLIYALNAALSGPQRLGPR